MRRRSYIPFESRPLPTRGRELKIGHFGAREPLAAALLYYYHILDAAILILGNPASCLAPSRANFLKCFGRRDLFSRRHMMKAPGRVARNSIVEEVAW